MLETRAVARHAGVLRVAAIVVDAALLERSHYPDHVVAAAVLHDVLEDRRTALRPRVPVRPPRSPSSSRSSATTRRSPTRQRKDDVRERVRHASGYAPVVHASDKVSKVRELRTLMTRGLDRTQAELRLRRYRRSLDMLEQTIPDNRIVELLRFELEALEQLPPSGGR